MKQQGENMDFFITSDIINKIAGQTETERDKDIICSMNNIVLLLDLMWKKSNFLLEKRIL